MRNVFNQNFGAGFIIIRTGHLVYADDPFGDAEFCT